MNKTTAANESTKGTTRLNAAARIVLALIFGLSGLNHVVGLMPMPPMSGDTALFWQGLAQSGYFFPLLGSVELAAAALLAWGRMLPLALLLVAPVVVHVAAFHALLAPQGLGVAALVFVTTAFLAYRHRSAFGALFNIRPQAQPINVRIVEISMGVAFVASGLAGFLGRTPPPATTGAAVMMRGFEAAGYLMPLLAGTQVIAGALLLARRCTGLALAALAPIVAEIVAYRLWVAPASPRMVLVAALLLGGQVWLCLAHRRILAPLFGEGRRRSGSSMAGESVRA